MIPLRKTSIRLTLLIAVAFAVGRADAQALTISPSANSPSATSVSTSGGTARSTGFGIFPSGHGSPSEPVTVVPAKQMDPPTAAQLIEDLSVMGRIIEKNAATVLASGDSDPASLYRRMRFDNWDAGPSALFSSLGRARPLYVAGYGALFFIRVDFPLQPPTETTEQAAKDEDETDSVWAETRRSIFEPETNRLQPMQGDRPTAPYDSARVDALKNALTATMKHAANIRGLDANEWLTIIVQTTAEQTKNSPNATAGNGSTLTLRTKKADVDLYAKGELAQAQFAQRLQVVSY